MRRSALLSAIGLALGLVLITDAATYATTGSSVVLGRLNAAGATTTFSMTGTGSALRLLTASSTAAPFTTNATGRVANLNADRLDGYEASVLISTARSDVDATRLAGRTLAEVLALAPGPRLTFLRRDAVQQPNPGAFPGILSATGAAPGPYRLAGTVTVPCSADNSRGYQLTVTALHSPTERTVLLDAAPLPATRCAIPEPVTTLVTMTPTTRLLVAVHDVDAGGPSSGRIDVALHGTPITRVL